WSIVSHHGVEDGEELAGDRNDGDHLWLSGRDEAVEEDLQDGVVLFGDHRPHEQGAAHVGTTSRDVAFALPLARSAGVWRQADKGSDLFAAEGAELGQLSGPPTGDHRSDTWNRPEQVLLLTPGGRAAHRIIDILLEACQLLLQGLDQASNAFLQPRRGDPLLALALGHHHVDDL